LNFVSFAFTDDQALVAHIGEQVFWKHCWTRFGWGRCRQKRSGM